MWSVCALTTLLLNICMLLMLGVNGVHFPVIMLINFIQKNKFVQIMRKSMPSKRKSASNTRNKTSLTDTISPSRKPLRNECSQTVSPTLFDQPFYSGLKGLSDEEISSRIICFDCD